MVVVMDGRLESDDNASIIIYHITLRRHLLVLS